MAKKSSYLSNVLKSIKYATIENIAEMNPVIVDVYKSNKDFVKDSIQEMKKKAESASSSSKGAIKDTITEAYKNLREDLSTGKFYNKERKDKAEDAAAMKAFGMDDIDFGSMGLDDDSSFDVFNENDDFGFDDSSSDSSESYSDDSQNTDIVAAQTMNIVMGRTSASISNSNRHTASAISGIMVKTSKLNADVIALSTDKLLGGITATSSVLHTDLTAMNNNLANIVEFSNGVLRTHVENSTTFFETQKQQMQEQTEILKEMLDIQKSIYKPERKSGDKVSISDIFTSEGGLDLSAYKDYLKQNSNNIVDSSIDMAKQFGPLLLAGITGSPLADPMKILTRKLIPDALEEAFTSLNDTISGIISTSLVNLTQAQKGNNGGFFQVLGDMFGLKVPELKINTSKYRKEAVPWNGKDHKALTEIIPTWLSKIYSGITGKDEMRYDYEKGKYISVTDIKKNYDKDFKYAVARANESVNEKLNKSLNKIKFTNDNQRDQIINAIQKIQEYNFKQMKNFNPNSKIAEDLNPATYGITGPNADKIMEIVKMLYLNMDKKAQLKGSGELLNSVSRYNKDLKEYEAAGDSVYNGLFDSSINENKIMDTPIMASAKRLDITNLLLEDILSAISGGRTTTRTTIIPKTGTVSGSKLIGVNKNTNATLVDINGRPIQTKATISSGNEKKSKKKKNPYNKDGFKIGDDPQKIKEMLESNEEPEETETYLQTIEKAETASDKIRAFFKGLSLLTKKPAEFLKSTINTVDTYAYNLFFGSGEDDVKTVSGKILKGFDNIFSKIGKKVNSVYTSIKDELKEQGKITFNGVFKSLFGKDFNESMKSFKKAMFGDENKAFFKGMADVFKSGFKEVMNDFFGGIKKKFNSLIGREQNEDGTYKEWKVGNLVDKVNDSFNEAYANKKEKKDTEEDIKNKMASGEMSSFEASSAIKELDKKGKLNSKKNQAFKGGKVTKTGLVAVSEGERIVPNYMDAASISGRELKENTLLDKFKGEVKDADLGEIDIANFARGGRVNFKDLNTKKNKHDKPNKDKSNKANKKSANSGGIQYSSTMSYKQFNKFYSTLKTDQERSEYRKRYAEDYAKNLVGKAVRKGIKTTEDAKDFCNKNIEKAIENNPALFDEIQSRVNYFTNSSVFNEVKRGVKYGIGYVGQMASEAKSGVKAFTSAFTEDEDFMKTIRDIGGKFNPSKEGKNILDDLLKNWKKYLPKTLAGSALGAGLSTIFGLIGGPILGAAVGAGVAITTKSEAIQNFLFGEEIKDQHGNKRGRKGGVFSKEVSSAIDKYGKDTGKGAILGGLAGMLPFMPGGPVTGLLIGSALGFAKNNETIQEGLFGNRDWLGKAKDMIVKQLPRMGLGSLVGAVTGPFGLTTNLLIGSTLGLVSDTQAFKNMIFGTKGVNGKRAGGLVGFIKSVTKEPLEGLNAILKDTRKFFNDEIFNPLKKAAKPLVRAFENIFISIGDKIASAFASVVWKPFGALLANRVIVPIEKIAGKFVFGLYGFGKRLLKTAIKPITFAGRMAEISQLSKVGMANGSASDRLIRRQEILDEYQQETDNLHGPFKGARKWRRNRKYNKMQDKLMNSESNKVDEMVAGVDNEKLTEMALVNSSIHPIFGTKKSDKAKERFAGGLIVKSNINQILDSEVAQKRISEKQRKLIIAELRKGEYKKSVDQIMNYCPSADFSLAEKKILVAKIKETAKTVREGIAKADKALEINEEYKKEYGFGIAGRRQKRVIEAEMKARGLSLDGTGFNYNKKEEKLEDLKVETPTDKFLKSIYTDVHGIFEKMVGKPQEIVNTALDEAAAAKEDFQYPAVMQNQGFQAPAVIGQSNHPTEQYQLTENGMVKIVTNDQGELVTDKQDSTTRETEKRREDKEKTQKGILSKLTGIGTSISDFFTGKKDDKKPSIFQKILNVLGMGFSFLGGSKLFTALKWAGALTGGAFVLGHYTRVPETDEDGNPLTDEDGNPIYKTVAGVIGDKIKEIFFGKDGEGGLYHWWTDKAWPVVKNLWLPNLVSWLETDAMPAALRGITNAGDALANLGMSVANWIMDSVVPEIITRLPGWLASIGGAFGESLLKKMGIKKEDVKNPDAKESGDTFNSSGIKTLEEVEKESNGQKGTTTNENSTTSNQTNSGSSPQTHASSNPIEEAVSKVSNYGGSYNDAQIVSGTNNNLATNQYTTTTDKQKKEMLKNSDIYKNMKNKDTQKEILNNKELLSRWDTQFPGTKYTYGQVLTTPGLVVGKNENTGKQIYSDDILRYPTYLNEFTGIDLRATNEEKEENTTHYKKKVFQNMPKALAISTMTHGTLSTKPLHLFNKAYSAAYDAMTGLALKVPVIGQLTASELQSTKLATSLPATGIELVNNFNKARANGGSFLGSVSSSVRDTFPTGWIKKKRGKTGLGEKVANGIETLEKKLGSKATEEAGDASQKGIIAKIKEWLVSKVTDSKLLNKMASKFNAGSSVIKSIEKVTNDKLKDLMLKITEKIILHLPKCGASIVSKIGTKVANAMGTGGVGIILDLVGSFLMGMKNADAYLEVEKVTFGERLVGGIVNVLCNTLLFGLIDANTVVQFVIDVMDKVLDMSSIRKRQAQLEEIVDKFNDENKTNYTPYDYLMKDKIETKINNFLHSRPMAWATYTVEGVAQGAVGGVIGAGKSAGHGALGVFKAVTTPGAALLKSGWQSITQGTNFFENMSTNFIAGEKDALGSFSSAGKAAKGGVGSLWKGLKHVGAGFVKTFTGKDIEAENPKTTTHDTKTGENYGGKGRDIPVIDENIIKDPFDSTSNTSKQDWTDISTIMDQGADKSLELTASQFGLSKTDLTGETSDYKKQVDDNLNTVNYINDTWQKVQKQNAPFYDELPDKMEKANNVLSRNLAVYYGLADASDEDADFYSILNDEAYLQKRAEKIQENSLYANMFGGVTGSNSNDEVKQDIAAKKKLQTSSSKLTGAKRILSDILGKMGKLAFGTGGSGSGVDEPAVSNVNPSEGVFVSQKYGKYANTTFGVGTNKLKVSEAGCAPSTAMMAVNANIGYESPLQMNEALKTASSYISDNGGVTADYFADEFAKHGFKTAYIPKSDNKQKEIMKYQLLNGRSIVLMGKDNSNHSKKKSPFGPNYHYVVATGLSSDGRYVYINDPEAKESNVRYDTDAIFNNTDLTIVPIKTSGRINALSGRLKEKLHKLSGKSSGGIIFVGDSRTVGMKQAIGENNKTKFIGKVGEGYSWLSNVAWTSVKSMARSNSDFSIVFNFGVNDLDNIDKYIEFYNSVVKPEFGDRVYFMSVNPTKDPYKGAANNSAIEKFNTKYKAFAGNKYIDTYTYLNGKGFQSPDGLHYDTQTYKDIYNFTVYAINGTGNSLASSTNLGGAANGIDGTSTTTRSTKSIKTIGDLISAIGSILAGSWGLSSSDTSYLTGSSSGPKSTTGSIDGTSGRVSSNKIIAAQQVALVDKMKSIEGKIAYSMTGPRDPDQGSADCSSTVQWAYKNVTGKDIGSWTGAQEQSSETTFVDQPHMSREFDESKLQLGDILLYGQNAGSHVEMYAGNGKVIGHGGPGNGPIIRDISSVHKDRNDRWSAKRLASFASGKGSGIFVSQKASKWANKKIGDEKVSEAGCAPAVATMAISNDNQYNMTQAINDAKDYKDKGGGVSADYFVDVFKRQGYNCLVITDKKKIINALKKGNNAVLIGRDLTNTSKKKSPFGPTDHYVLAVGISKNGKYVYINDPEATEPNIEYKTSIVMSGVRVAIIPVTINNSRMKGYSKSLGDVLSNFVGKAATTNNTGGGTSASSILSQCAKFQTQLTSDIKKGIKWTRTTKADNLAEDWSRAKTQKHTSNALLFIRWALREAGLLSKISGRFNPSTNGDITFTGTAKDELGRQFDIISVKSKTVNQMVASGDLKPGDIVSYVSFNHMNIYAGNGKWYDAGSAYCKKSTDGAEYTSWMGDTKYGNQYVGTIMRKKAAANSTTGDTTSGDTVDNSSVSLEGTGASSSGTVLDQLANAFADLAAAWGLSSNSSDDANIDSGSGNYSGGSATAVTGSDAKAKVWNYLHNKGIPDNGIAGAMGNMQHESGIEFNRVESDFSADRSASKQYTNDVNSGAVSESAFVNNQSPRSSWPHINGHEYGPGYGLVQWTSPGRKQGLYNLAKQNNTSIDDPQTSMDWLWQELQSSSYAPTLNAMKEGSSVRAVSDVFLHNFESPSDQSETVQQSRAQAGTTILQEMTGKGSGLSATGINRSANSAIKSINRTNKGKSITTVRNLGSIMGKGSGLDDNNVTTAYSSTDNTTPIYSANITKNQVAVDSKSSIDTNALLNAIIKLLTQEVKNTASIQGIADAIVTLVDSKVNSETDVSTKKQLLDTKQQVLSLVRNQNNTSASTSLNDLITSVETITAQ